MVHWGGKLPLRIVGYTLQNKTSEMNTNLHKITPIYNIYIFVA